MPNLSKYADYRKILKALSYESVSDVLPISLDCPLCSTKNHLFIYRDSNLGGEWYHCKSCRKCGDMIELSAKVWGLSIDTTIVKLLAIGAIDPNCYLNNQESIRIYIDNYVGRRERVNKLWSQYSSPAYDDSKVLAKLHSNFLLRKESIDRWRPLVGGGPINLLASLSKEGTDRNAAVAVSDMSRYMSTRENKSTLFKESGQKWTDVIAVPYYDMPGRIRSFLFIGPSGGSTDRHWVIKRVHINSQFTSSLYAADKLQVYDCGFAMYDAIEYISSEFKDYLYVFTDPMVAARLHSKHFLSSSLMLPIVATYDKDGYGTRDTYYNIPTKNFLFWSPKYTPELFSQARLVGGRVFCPEYDPRRLCHGLHDFKSREWLHILYRDSKPWDDALLDVLNKSTPEEAESLLLKTEMTDYEVDRFLAKCSQEVKDRMRQISGKSTVMKAQYVSNRVIVEIDNKWHIGGSGELLSDACIRIDNVLHYERKKKTVYQGRVLYDNETIPFETDDSEFLDNQIRWIRNFLISRGKGIPRIFIPYKTSLEMIALAFNRPITKLINDRVGWHDATTSFVFPRFTISGLCGTLGDPVAIGDEDLPCRSITISELTPFDIEILSRCDDVTKVFWATAVSVLANVIAPAVNSFTVPLAIVGRGAMSISATTAKALGCLEYETGKVSPVEVVKDINKLSKDNNWPSIIYLHPRTAPILEYWLQSNESQNCICPMSYYDAAIACMDYGWNMLEYDEHNRLTKELSDAAGKVVYNYLQDLCSRRLTYANESEDHYLNILDDVIKWFDKVGGNSIVIRDVPSIVLLHKNYKTPSDLCAGLMTKLISENRLTTKIIGGNCFISSAEFFDGLESRGIPLLGMSSISKSLRTIGVLKDNAYNRISGWVIDGDWAREKGII